MKDFIKPHIPRQFLPFARRLYFFLRSVPYVGKQVCCPICGGHFRRFIPFGVGKKIRENAICPRCYAVERHRLLWLYLRDRTNLFQDRLKILHFAPEFGFQQRLRTCANLDYTSADLDMPDAMVKSDITALPFANNTFDVILCSHVLQYIPDDRKAMSELYRVLKPGGWAILFASVDVDRAITFEDPTVADPQERLHLSKHTDPVRIYGRDYVTRLEQAGFSVRQDDYAHEIDPSLFSRYALCADPIFYCTK